MTMVVPCTPGLMTGDASFGMAPGGQSSFWAVAASASLDGDIFLNFKIGHGTTVPSGAKTLALHINAGGTSLIYRLKTSFVRVLAADGDPEAALSTPVNLDVTMTAARDEDNFTETVTISETLAAGDTLRVKLEHDTSATTITGETLYVLDAELSIAA